MLVYRIFASAPALDNRQGLCPSAKWHLAHPAHGWCMPLRVQAWNLSKGRKTWLDGQQLPYSWHPVSGRHIKDTFCAFLGCNCTILIYPASHEDSSALRTLPLPQKISGRIPVQFPFCEYHIERDSSPPPHLA